MFIPHTQTETDEMLAAIGLRSLADLFQNVPAKYRFPKLDLPDALSEMEALSELKQYAAANETAENMVCFLGAGAYQHYIPAAVDSLLRRGEFYTAYTPYQPEISQGTLQAIFEFQSLIANLTGMEVANASHYDGATATAEAGVMAYHHFRGKRSKILVSEAIHPQYREVLCTYLCGNENIHIESASSKQEPLAEPAAMIPQIDEDTALVLVQYPDFFGRVYDLTELTQKAHEAGALVGVIANPTALGLFKAPGEYGVDIVVGEGQPLGIPLSFGGPYLGFFATRKAYARQMSGRIAGETVDSQGRKGYVLTLTAREQHIRREKASSNICTNQGLMALAATIYLSLLGKQGFKQVASLCYQKAHYAAQELGKLKGFKVLSQRLFFHEFVLECPKPVAEINQYLLTQGFLGGYDLSRSFPTLKNQMLVAVTEMNTRDEIDAFIETMKEVKHD